MGKNFLLQTKVIINKTLFIIFLSLISQVIIYGQAVYVDCNTGNDNNEGTEGSPFYSITRAAEVIKKQDNNIYIMKINPGIYVLNKHVPVYTEKEMTGKRIIM